MTSFFDHLDPILNEAPLFCQVKGKTLRTVLNKYKLNKWNDGKPCCEFRVAGYGLTPYDFRLTIHGTNKD